MVSVRIPLTKGKIARVSIQDAERVMAHKWCALEVGGKFYGVRSVKVPGRKSPDTVYLHRFILDAEKGVQVDHADLDRLNCTHSNLRRATHGQNQQNKGLRADNKSGFMGVGWNAQKGKWQARISANKVHHHIGFFDNKKEAALAYDRKAIELHGGFARTNFDPFTIVS